MGKKGLRSAYITLSPFTEDTWDRKIHDLVTPIQFRVTVRYHCTFTRKTTSKNTNHSKGWQGCGATVTFIHYWESIK